MFHNKIELKDGAFIISDAHFSKKRDELLEFFKEIKLKKLNPTQIILMGDIFDALFGGISHTYIENQELIDIINEISKYLEIIYIEGNHDFNLSSLFPDIAVYPIKYQPVEARLSDKKIYLAHGDFNGDKLYMFYTSLIRNQYLLFFLKYIDILLNHYILKSVNKHLNKKDDCNSFSGFKEFIQYRLENRFDCDYFIEGHFHQNSFFSFKSFNYINLAAFACNQRYFIIKYSKESNILLEKKFSKGR